MKKIRYIAYSLFFLFTLPVLSACSFTGASTEEVRLTTVSEATVMPDTMPDDFAVCFEYWIDSKQRNILDTYTGRIQKDLVMNGTQHSAFSCEKQDLESIYAKMQELSIFDLSGNLISDSIQVTPNEMYLIRYRINGREYTVSGDGTTSILVSIEGQHLDTLMKYLRNYMVNTSEYKAMPESEGGYD